MTYLFFDTETTGLPDYNKPLDDPEQPHIVQLACILTDGNGREMQSFKAPIIPEGFTIDETSVAFKVNKLTTDDLQRYGIRMPQALAMFRQFESKAILKVAHNYRFDGFLLKVAHTRAGILPLDPAIDKFCTMKIAQDLKAENKIPSAKLVDFYKHVTGEELDNAHDALADVRACKEVFFWIKRNGLYREQPRTGPKVAA